MDVGHFGEDRRQRLTRQRVQDQWMDAYAPIRHLDPILVGAAVLLTLIGVVMIYSATFRRLELQELQTTLFATKQLLNLAIATIAMIAAAIFDYRTYRAYTPIFYVGVLVMLILVLTPLGVTVNGAKRWLEIGGFQLQPSEVAKVAVIVTLSAFLHERKGEAGLPTVLFSLLLVGGPMFLIFIQPDLGTMITFVWITFVLLLVGGVKGRFLVALGAIGLIAVFGVFHLDVLEDYQRDRLTAFLDPANPSLSQTVRYNADQSLIAIGSGQFAGKGLLEGTQTNLSYVPENHTDFIFTVVGEEFGFLGAAGVLALFGIIVWRGLRIAAMSKDTFGRMLAGGVIGLMVMQVFVNVGMTIGIMPVTGIPLPFVSYGGTSLIMWFTMMGLLLNVHMRRF